MQRWQKEDEVKADGRKEAAQGRTPKNALSPKIEERILEVINQPEFADKTPHQIVPMLADRGIYIASEATFYRVMRKHKQLTHRGKAKPPTRKRPGPLKADGPNQLWSWDITYLMTSVSGVYFYLYLIMDVFSRKIVGWEVYACESSEHASEVFEKAHLREGVGAKKLRLHSDNGAPMKGATMLATLQKLGVVPSFSRPSVSNDNPYSESLFKTLKYRPAYPEQPFADLDEARHWVRDFVLWYNEEHRHSQISFVTPAQRHRGEDTAILAQRQQIYAAARAEHSERWSGNTRSWKRIDTVYLNPGKPAQATEEENTY